MPDLTIRIKKKSDGSAALTVIRADGTTSWQQQNGPSGAFFPLHDLTHYAVETVLEHKRGFYGLMAEGWDFTDFGNPWPRGPIPADAEPAELIVGLLDAERATGETWTADQMRQMACDFLRISELPNGLAMPTELQLEQIRSLRYSLFEQWRSIPPGDSLELEFLRA